MPRKRKEKDPAVAIPDLNKKLSDMTGHEILGLVLASYRVVHDAMEHMRWGDNPPDNIFGSPFRHDREGDE